MGSVDTLPIITQPDNIHSEYLYNMKVPYSNNNNALLFNYKGVDDHQHLRRSSLSTSSSDVIITADQSIIVARDEGHHLEAEESHLQQQEEEWWQQLEDEDHNKQQQLFGSTHEPSSTTSTTNNNNKNRRKNNNNTPPQEVTTTIINKEPSLSPLLNSNINNNYDHTESEQLLGMNNNNHHIKEVEKSSLTSAADHKQQQQQQYTNLRKTTCHEEIPLYNSNDDSIIIRSYNYETDEKQVNKIFVEGIKSIVPNYLQTFYLFIHHFGIVQVFSILSLFYISSFIIQFGIIKLFILNHPVVDATTTATSTTTSTFTSQQQQQTLFSILLSFTNLSTASTTATIGNPCTIYATISTFITCTSMVILMICGLSKYVDYSVRSYIYQQFKYSDMSNIQKYYIWDEDNHFWVAQLKSTGEIVGTIGVRKRANQEETVELKRMSVSSSMKRKGVASLMLNHLVKWSKEKGYKTIVLSTSSLQAAAVDFYKKNGFSIVKMRRYSRFLPTAHLTFEKHL